MLDAGEGEGVALGDVRLQAEARVRALLEVGRVDAVGDVLLDGDVVVVQMDVEVVQLVVGHLAHQLVQPVHREGLAAHVEDDAAHLVERVVARLALGQGAIALLGGLQQRLGTPVGARRGVPIIRGRRGHRHARAGDGERVALLAERHDGGVGARREDDAVAFALHRGDLEAEHLG